MRLTDVNIPVIRRRIEELGPELDTWGVSDGEQVKAAHRAHVGEWAYRSVIGRVIGQNAAELGVRKGERSRGQRGQRWVKTR